MVAVSKQLKELVNDIQDRINVINTEQCHFSKDLNELKNNDINKDVINRILDDGYMYHKDMEAVSCILESYIRMNKIQESIDLMTPEQIQNIVYNSENSITVNDNINTYIKNIRPLSKGTASSEVYLADLFVNGSSLVIKFPNSDIRMDKTEFMKEYILGKSINKLRRITPSFMYTFSLFGCSVNKMTNRICEKNKSLPLIILEKVNGESMKKFIHEPSTNFEEWLKVYVQILLNLEIAQKLYKFNHNDLHHENVMIREEKQPITYSFDSETKTYKITTSRFPVLIDFGYSGMDVYGKHVKGVDLGVAFPPEFVPCYDMYLHLARCIHQFYTKNSNRITLEVKKLFNLYEFFTGDPYDGFNKNINLLHNEDWFFKINFKKTMLRKTPGEFLEWIMDRYGSVLSDTITVSKRETYINPIPNNSNMYNNFYIGKYHEIIPLKTNSGVITKIIQKFTTCTTEQKYMSYITSLQSLKILESMTENNTNKTVNDTKKVFSDMITNKKRKELLIATDLVRLNTLFTDDKLKVKFDNIDMSKIDDILSKPDVTTSDIMSINTLMSDFITFMKHYYDVYLMIKELGITTEYKDWVSKFEQSDMFTYYEEVADKVDHFNRYVYTLNHLLFD